MTSSAQDVITAAMSVARDAAEGRLNAAELEATAADECRRLFSTVAGPNSPLWSLQVEVARGVLAAGGIPAPELREWAAVTAE